MRDRPRAGTDLDRGLPADRTERTHGLTAQRSARMSGSRRQFAYDRTEAANGIGLPLGPWLIVLSSLRGRAFL